ncbi:MAG: hypothetical protein QW728_04360, partial [Thermoplasmata archaeon]
VVQAVRKACDVVGVVVKFITKLVMNAMNKVMEPLYDYMESLYETLFVGVNNIVQSKLVNGSPSEESIMEFVEVLDTIVFTLSIIGTLFFVLLVAISQLIGPWALLLPVVGLLLGITIPLAFYSALGVDVLSFPVPTIPLDISFPFSITDVLYATFEANGINGSNANYSVWSNGSRQAHPWTFEEKVSLISLIIAGCGIIAWFILTALTSFGGAVGIAAFVFSFLSFFFGTSALIVSRTYGNMHRDTIEILNIFGIAFGVHGVIFGYMSTHIPKDATWNAVTTLGAISIVTSIFSFIASFAPFILPYII